MIPENFKIEYVEKIFDLYNACVGPCNTDILSPYDLLKDIQTLNLSQGYRIGSRWSVNSKLTFTIEHKSDNIIPSFNPNFDPSDRNSKKHDEAVFAGRLFQTKSLEYLASLR